MRESCRNCGAGRPLTSEGYCAPCASYRCALGDGQAVGLPLPGPDGVRALAAHLARHDFASEVGCLVCALATPQCSECGLRTDDMTPAELALHVTVDVASGGLEPRTPGGAAGAVAVGCEGYVGPAVRAAALEARGDDTCPSCGAARLPHGGFNHTKIACMR